MARIDTIVELMFEVVPPDLLNDLSTDPTVLIPKRFPPTQVVPVAGGTPLRSDACSCDGYYEDQLVPGVPHLLYVEARTPRRSRFTVLHEFGHLVIRHLEPDLLDVLDEEAGPSGDVGQLEERTCHAFAGRLLIPDAELAAVVGGGAFDPQHVIDLYNRRGASWEAAAVRLAGAMRGSGAVVVVRRAGHVGFSASAPGLARWWPRESRLDPAGPLARATSRPCRSQPDTFRYGLPGAITLWCSVRQPWAGLGIATLSDRPPGGKLNLLPKAEDEWARLYCLRCGELREGEWCFDCREARCNECGACGCYRPAPQRLCEGPCGMLKGLGTFDSGSDVCRDCLS